MNSETSRKCPDRRVRRTRMRLKDALVALILEKGYRRLTVQDIIDRGDVGRSTFYAHYRDKEDLLESVFDELAHDLDRHVQSHPVTSEQTGHLIHSLDFFRHAHDNRDFYRAMVESGGAELLQEIGRRHMQDHLQAHIAALSIDETSLSMPIDLILNYLAGTLLSLIVWWLDEEEPCSPEEMDERFNRLVMPGVWKELG